MLKLNEKRPPFSRREYTLTEPDFCVDFAHLYFSDLAGHYGCQEAEVCLLNILRIQPEANVPNLTNLHRGGVSTGCGSL
jgi:hypothetical protein